MKPFDGNDYRKRVMARLLDDFTLADPHTGDPFLVCDVDADADPAAVARRLDEVVAFWQKDRNHPKYKGVAAQLVARRDDYHRVLTDPSARAQTAARVQGARAETDAAAVDQLDKLAAALLKRHRGIPRSRVEALSAIATAEGMSHAAFTQWLGRHTLVDDADPDGAAPWEMTVRNQVRSALDELARIDTGSPTRYRTLLTFLGVGPNANRGELTAAHARLTAANRARTRDRVMTVTEDLLAQVSTRLLPEGGMVGYLASLRADARDSIKGDLRRLAVLTGSLPASEMEALSARVVGLGWGIAVAEVRDLVRAAAHEVHLAVEVGGEVDLIVCPSCHRPQTVSRRRTCSYCRAHLYTDCPACSTTVPAASDVCPACAAPLAVWRAAAAAVPKAQEALDEGRPVTAAQIARDALGGMDPAAAPAPLRAVLASAEEVVHRAAQTAADLQRDLERGRLWSAATAATWLVRNAEDCVGPDVPDPAETLARIEARKQQVLAAVTEATQLAPESAERHLSDLLSQFPDCPEATAALARLPLPAPRAITVALTNGVATLAWDPAAGVSRTARYQVHRHVTWPPTQADHTIVGTTATTHLEDAAAPAGTLVAYTVTTVDGSRTSPPADSGDPVFVHRDVEVLHTRVEGTTVVLTWPALGLGAAETIMERSVDPASGLTLPTRRIRPAEPGRLVDDDVAFDVPYTYRLSLTYHAPDGTLVRTEGQATTVTLRHPPQPVADMWAATDDAGRTTISFRRPPSGVVRVYASPNGSEPLAGFEHGSVRELEQRAAGDRLVGEGQRRVVDTGGRGQVRYRAFTVVDDVVVAGTTVTHMAIAKPANLHVVRDAGGVVKVGFELPPGVTEAFVCWRRDRYPVSADEPVTGVDGAGAAKVTNTKLSIGGGFDIAAPEDGRALFVAVYPAVRTDPSGPVTPAPVAASFRAREATEQVVEYTTRVGGLLRKKLEVTVFATPGELPPLRLVAASTEPTQPGSGTVLAEHPGGGHGATLRVDDDAWTEDVTVRLFALPAPGAVVRVVEPPIETRRLSR